MTVICHQLVVVTRCHSLIKRCHHVWNGIHVSAPSTEHRTQYCALITGAHESNNNYWWTKYVVHSISKCCWTKLVKVIIAATEKSKVHQQSQQLPGSKSLVWWTIFSNRSAVINIIKFKLLVSFLNIVTRCVPYQASTPAGVTTLKSLLKHYLRNICCY